MQIMIRSAVVTRFERFDPSVHYWKMVRAIARDLLGRDMHPVSTSRSPRSSAASPKTSEGVAKAMTECTGAVLQADVEDRGCAAPHPSWQEGARGGRGSGWNVKRDWLARPVKLADRNRWVLMLGHPSAGQRKKPSADEIGHIQTLLS